VLRCSLIPRGLTWIDPPYLSSSLFFVGLAAGVPLPRGVRLRVVTLALPNKGSFAYIALSPPPPHNFPALASARSVRGPSVLFPLLSGCPPSSDQRIIPRVYGRPRGYFALESLCPSPPPAHSLWRTFLRQTRSPLGFFSTPVARISGLAHEAAHVFNPPPSALGRGCAKFLSTIPSTRLRR